MKNVIGFALFFCSLTQGLFAQSRWEIKPSFGTTWLQAGGEDWLGGEYRPAVCAGLGTGYQVFNPSSKWDMTLGLAASLNGYLTVDLDSAFSPEPTSYRNALWLSGSLSVGRKVTDNLVPYIGAAFEYQPPFPDPGWEFKGSNQNLVALIGLKYIIMEKFSIDLSYHHGLYDVSGLPDIPDYPIHIRSFLRRTLITLSYRLRE